MADRVVNPAQATDSGRTLLHILSSARPDLFDNINLDGPGQVLAFDLLLDRLRAGGDHFDASDMNGTTPLHLAVATSAHQVRRLLAVGADPARPNSQGSTPLHCAVQAGDGNIVGMIMQALGASYETQQDASNQPASSNATVSRAINAQDAQKRTALYYACFSGSPSIFRLLLEAGATAPSKVGSQTFENSCWHAIALSDTTRPYANPRDPTRTEGCPERRIDEMVDFLLKESEPADIAFINKAIELAEANQAAYVFEALSHARNTFLSKHNLPVTHEASQGTASAAFLSLQRRRENRTETENPDIPAQMRYLRLMNLQEYPIAKLLLEEIVSDTSSMTSADMFTTADLLSSNSFTDMLYLLKDVFNDRMQPNHASLLFSAIGQPQPNMPVLRILVEDFELNVNTVNTNGRGLLHRLFQNDKSPLGESGDPAWWKSSLALPYLVSHGADVNMRDRDGSTPLHYVLDRVGHVDFDSSLVERLIALGADVAAADRAGRTCLCRAARNRHDIGPGPSQQDGPGSVDSPRHDLALVKLLLKAGAPVTQPTMIDAIRDRDTALLNLLLSPLSCADPNTRVIHRDRGFLERYAEHSGDSRGGDAEQDPWRYTPPLAINVVPDPLIYPLHFACLEYPHDKALQTIIKMLLDHGADPSARYENGMTVLHYVVSQQVERAEMIKLLLDRASGAAGSDSDSDVLEARNPLGMTLLVIVAHMAGRKDSTDSRQLGASVAMAHTLLDLGAEPDVKDNAGKGVLHHLNYYEDGSSRDVGVNDGVGSGTEVVKGLVDRVRRMLAERDSERLLD
ncbi:ankyrin repeat domain-containing protein 50 [Microdochium nivale]|nr:ankyrin repeat domain-containing protein 50 [Microdochium nivale]